MQSPGLREKEHEGTGWGGLREQLTILPPSERENSGKGLRQGPRAQKTTALADGRMGLGRVPVLRVGQRDSKAAAGISGEEMLL